MSLEPSVKSEARKYELELFVKETLFEKNVILPIFSFFFQPNESDIDQKTSNNAVIKALYVSRGTFWKDS